jgi:glycosyltransferase involved in cell wall biosynthesis
MARVTTRFVVVAEAVKEDLVRMEIAGPEDIEVIPVGLDFSGFEVSAADRTAARAGLRRELGIADDELVVTTVGRVVPIKRVDRFLRIAGSLKDVPRIRFLVVGDGEEREALMASPEARALGEQVIWTGYRSDLPPVYFASDLVTLTSDNEGTPTSLIEAQAAGLPVVCTDVGGTRETAIDGTTGYLVDVGQEDAFAAAVRRLLDDPGVRSRFGSEGRRHALQAFPVDRLVADVERLYDRLLRSGAPSRRSGHPATSRPVEGDRTAAMGRPAGRNRDQAASR